MGCFSQNIAFYFIIPNSEDEAYWKQFASVIDDKKKRLWDALIDAFEKYSQVLTERATLIQETEALRQQVRSLIGISEVTKSQRNR